MVRGAKVLKVKPIPVPLACKHPLPPNDVLPAHEFSMGIIAPKGSGKTTVICNLLNFYKGYFHTIIIFSPTVASDEKWDWVKKQSLLIENLPLKKWLKAHLQEKMKRGEIVQAPPQGYELGRLQSDSDPEFDGKIPEEMFFTEYSVDDLKSFMDQQKAVIQALKKHGQSKHLANRLLIIFDDLVGSSLFSGSRDNPFKTLNTNHRHYSASILMVSQAYKEIPKTVRTQFSCLVVFEIPNDREVQVVYEENPMNLKQDQWEEMYRHATEGDHNFLFINYQKPKRLRCMKNFDSVLFHAPAVQQVYPNNDSDAGGEEDKKKVKPIKKSLSTK